MSGEQTAGFLLRLYPGEWRARYGAELESLILETSDGRVSWSVRVDVAAGAVRERLRTLLGRPGRNPRSTLATSLPAMLWAWLLVVVGGGIVGKSTEHWAGATPAGGRSLPSAGFDLLAGGAIAASAIVVGGALLALPAALALLRGEHRQALLRPAAVALVSTVALAVATASLAAWAHGLSSAQRNGHDALYSAAFVGWGLLAVFTLAAWTFLGARAARLASLGALLLRVESVLAAAAAAAMVSVTIGAALWWAGVARSAPSFLGGGSPRLVAALAVMAVGTLLAVGSASRSVRAAFALPAEPGR